MAEKVITEEIVRRVGILAGLSLSDEEVRNFTQELGVILAYIDKLKEVDTSKIEPTTHILRIICPMREDKVESFEYRNGVLENLPAKDENWVRVPKIIE